MFHKYGDVTIIAEELHILTYLTYVRHILSLRREGSLAYHIYFVSRTCDLLDKSVWQFS